MVCGFFGEFWEIDFLELGLSVSVIDIGTECDYFIANVIDTLIDIGEWDYFIAMSLISANVVPIHSVSS